jgi:hypothetical protein
MKRPAFPAGVRTGLAAAIAAATLLSAGPAYAYFATTDSSHPAQAAAITLSAPGQGSQSAPPSPKAISIQWSAPQGYTPTGYTVLRCSGSTCANFTAITAGGCSGTVTTTSCTDGALPAGTYRYEIEADLDNWVSPPDAPFTAKTAPPTTLAFTLQPLLDQLISALGTGTFDVSVAVEAADGTTASNDSTDSVTLAIDPNHNPGRGTLTCASGLTVKVSAGIAAFTGCAIDRAGVGYELTASSVTDPSLSAPANANLFTIIAGLATAITVTAGADQSAPTTTTYASPLVATVQDTNGNPVPNVPVTFTAPAAGASASFSTTGCKSNPSGSSCVATTGSNGKATSSALTAGPKAGTAAISASATGAGHATFTETNVPSTTISSLTTTGTAGKLGAGDTITAAFSGQLDASTVCSGWTSGSTAVQSAAGSVVTVQASGAGDDLLSYTKAPATCGIFNFGTIDLGSSEYYSPPKDGAALTFPDSTVSYDGTSHVLQVTLGSPSKTGTENAVTASALALNLSSAILDTGEHALASYTYTTSSSAQF